MALSSKLASLVAQTVKTLLTEQETRVQSLDWEDPGIGEGHGNPLQYSCLENSMDSGAWWATVHGVSESQTQLILYPLRNMFTPYV